MATLAEDGKILSGEAKEAEKTMETLWGSKITRSELQQSIRNLKRLDELPEISRENLPILNTDPRRHLSVAREIEITGNLAFLSAISDDSLKIMAVCIEEHPNGKGITIRVASNTGDLESVSRGLTKLARELEHAARRGQVVNFSQLYADQF